MDKNLTKNLIPVAMIVAALIVAAGVVGATIIYVKGVERSQQVLEKGGTAALVQPETPPAETPPADEKPKEEPPAANLENFAKCLGQKGMKFYGASWCSWCVRQKQLFGPAVQYLPYIECIDKETQQMTSACQAAGITSFPTWELPNKEKSPGFKELEKLAELSGCQL